VDPRFEHRAIFVIDGNTRVNKWVPDKNNMPRLALIIETSAQQ